MVPNARALRITLNDSIHGMCAPCSNLSWPCHRSQTITLFDEYYYRMCRKDMG